VVPGALVPPAGPLLQRDEELTRLRSAWERARRGGAVTVAVRGPSGAGATRLAQALAEEVAHSGARVTLLNHAETETDAEASTGAPTLIVADHVQAPAVGAYTLLLLLRGRDAPVSETAEVIDLAPLEHDGVRALVEQYVGIGISPTGGTRVLDELTAQVLAESAGWPGPAHEAALRCGRRAAVERIESAVSRVDSSAVSLTSAREELSSGVAMLSSAASGSELDSTDGCPWRGLESYGIDDGPWFCGRERLVAELVSRLAGTRLLAVVGASGSGKSSAVRAGLLAALADDVLPGSAAWTRVSMRPGAHPMRELGRQALGQRGASVGDLLAHLVREESDPAGTRVLLVVDQLEETWSACQDPGERAAFLDTLAELSQDPRSPVTVILVVRADYVGALAEHEQLAALVADGTLLVGSPTSPEIRRAIETPASRARLRLDEGLADSLVTDAGAEPGLLPLLSTALTQLWERRSGRSLTFAAYVRLGGLSGAIAGLAEDAYGALTADEQDAARMLLLRLTGPGDGLSVTRRRVPLQELEALPHEGVRGIVEALTRSRLLTTSDGHVEVAHEALFREWPRLRGWLLEDGAGRAVQRRLALAATEWDAEGRESGSLWRGTRLASALEVADARPEEITATEREFLDAGRAAIEGEQQAAEARAAAAAKQNRRLRALLAGLAVVLVGALVAGLLAMRATAEAEASRVSADAKRLAATALNEEYPDLAMLSAIEAVRMEESPETYGALLTLLSRTPELVTRVRTPNRFLRNGVSADGSTVFLSENEPRMRAVDAETGAQLWERGTPGAGQIGSWTALPSGDAFAPVLSEEVVAARVDASDGSVVWQIDAADLEEAAGPSTSSWMWNESGLLRGGRIVFATDSHVFVADPSDGDIVRAVAWPEPQRYDETLHVWPDGRVSLSAGPGPRVFDLARPDRGFRRLSGTPLALSPDGRRVALVSEGTADATLRLHDARTYLPVSETFALGGFSREAVWSGDGSQLLLAVDEDVQLRDGRTGALIDQQSAHSGAVMDLAVGGPADDLVWTAGRDGSAIALDLSGRRGVLPTSDSGFESHVGAGPVSGDVGVATPWYEDRVNPAHLVDLDTGRDLFGELTVKPGCEWCQVNSVAITHDGRRALGGIAVFAPPDFDYEQRGYLAIWDTADGSLLELVRTPWAVFGVDVTPDGRLAVLNGEHGYAVLDLQTAQFAHEPVRQRQMGWVDAMPNTAVSPDGRKAVLGRDDRMLLVDLASGQVLSERAVEEEAVSSVTWSGDGRHIVAGGLSGRLRFLSGESLTEVAPTRLVTGGFVIDLKTSRDGHLMASIGSDGDVVLWDAATWQPIGQPVTDDKGWGWLHFTEDERLQVFFESGELVELAVDPSVWLEHACRAANRDLTPEESAIVRPGLPLRSTCGDLG
jgi:WD40 repeat protein